MSSGGENNQLAPHSTFSRFSDLALELRNQIWQHSIQSIAATRTIAVTISHQPAVIMHSCLPLGSFCGQHSHCPSYNPDSDQPSSRVVCAFNGYFHGPLHTIADPAEITRNDSALLNLSLVCTESRRAVLFRYPETITIYRQLWHPGVNMPRPRRQVRCNPTLDLLIVDTVSNYDSQQRHPSPNINNPADIYHEDLKNWFPQNPDVFANFRSIVSSFRHVVFAFLHPWGSSVPFPSEELESIQFKQLLIFFERLECFYVYGGGSKTFADSRTFQRVDDISVGRGGSIYGMDQQSLLNVSSGIVNYDISYNNYVQAQGELPTDSGECCWVPKGTGQFFLQRINPPGLAVGNQGQMIGVRNFPS